MLIELFKSSLGFKPHKWNLEPRLLLLQQLCVEIPFSTMKPSKFQLEKIFSNDNNNLVSTNHENNSSSGDESSLHTFGTLATQKYSEENWNVMFVSENVKQFFLCEDKD